MRSVLKDLSFANFKYLWEKILGLPFYKAFSPGFCGLKVNRRFIEIANRLKSGLPFEYAVQESEFLGLEFKVGPSVLIPRKETEFLAESAVKYINKERLLKVLDLGTGSGNIGISIAKNTLAELIVCSDRFDVFKIARFNSERHKAPNVRYVKDELFKGFKRESFNLVVSNPPYVEESFLKASDSLRKEPLSALWAGEDGLLFIREIINTAHFVLKENGILLIETGFGQIKKAGQIARRLGRYKILEIVRDYSGIERVLALRKNG